MSPKDTINNEKRNWYIAEIIKKCEAVERDESQELRRVTTWGNHHLVKAESPEKAYDKAVAIGKEGEFEFTNDGGLKMEWVFVGIGELLPIYENIEDGAELMWKEYGFISSRRTSKMVFEKEELMKLLKAPKNITKP